MLAECRTTTIWCFRVLCLGCKNMLKDRIAGQNVCNCEIPLSKSIPQEFLVVGKHCIHLGSISWSCKGWWGKQRQHGECFGNDLHLSSSCLSHGSEQKSRWIGALKGDCKGGEAVWGGFSVLWESQPPLVSCPCSRQWLLFGRYEISFKQHVGTEDVFFGMTGKDPSTACCEDIVVSWAWSSDPFFVPFLCPFPSSHLFEGQNVNTKLYCCLWPPVAFSRGSPSICRWHLLLLTWGTCVSPQGPNMLKGICANAYAPYKLKGNKTSSEMKFHLGHSFGEERGWEGVFFSSSCIFYKVCGLAECYNADKPLKLQLSDPASSLYNQRPPWFLSSRTGRTAVLSFWQKHCPCNTQKAWGFCWMLNTCQAH